MWDMDFKTKARAAYTHMQWNKTSALKDVNESVQLVEMLINIDRSSHP